jgi:SPP1 gp7 family putative phage head morphogenesis protein
VQVLRPFAKEIQDIILNAKSIEEVEKKLAEWESKHSKNTELSGMLFGPALQADLAGQLMIDIYDTKKVKLRQNRYGQLYLFQQQTAFFDLEWTEAIEAFKQMDIPRHKEFLKYIEQYSRRGEEARQLLLERLKKRSLESVMKALEEGTTFREFAGDLDQLTDSLGIGEVNPSYLETVFRTNVSSAYGSGRQKALEEVKEQRPYWQYRTARDARVRENHAPLDGMICEHGNAETDALKPPNGYNCRCVMVAYTLKPGDNITTKAPVGGHSDPGFNKSPLSMIRESIT